MKINQVIEKVKNYYQGTNPDGSRIVASQTRDQVLFGNTEQVCQGIIVTCFASFEVIEKAIEQGANLIICHEALFWNRGDKTDWLVDNQTFIKKKQLLKDHGIVVWRNHDYIHSGIPMNNTYVDGIFYGVMKTLEWEKYVVSNQDYPLSFEFPDMASDEIGRHLIHKLKLNGLRIIGNPNMKVKRLLIAEHIMGGDNDTIQKIESEGIDALITLELIDYTVSEYIRDANASGTPKVIFSVGHFNLEEFGMAYMVNYLPGLFDKTIQVAFVQSGDSYKYL